MQPEICIGGGGGQSWQVSNINLPNTMQNKTELRRIFQNNRIGNEASQIPKFPYWNYFQHSAMEMFIQVAQLMVFNDCGEMFSTGQQCQLLELLLRLDWKAKDTDKRHMYLEFRLIPFIMTAGKKYSLKLGSDRWSCKERLEVFVLSSNRIDWVISVLTILDNIPPLKNRLIT